MAQANDLAHDVAHDPARDAARDAALHDLRRIPGVGKRIAVDLWDLGMRSVAQLDGEDAEDLYDRLCGLRGAHIDRCMLYVLRCAVYFAGPGPHDPELLNWWAWKDTPAPQRAAARVGERAQAGG